MAWARVATIARETVSTLSISRDLFVVSSLSQHTPRISMHVLSARPRAYHKYQKMKIIKQAASAHTQSPVHRNNFPGIELVKKSINVICYIQSNCFQTSLSIFVLREQTTKMYVPMLVLKYYVNQFKTSTAKFCLIEVNLDQLWLLSI